MVPALALALITCGPQPVFPIHVVGEDHRWIVTYPGPDLLLGTEDDIEGIRDIYVPAGRRIHVDLDSKDYI